MNKDQANVILSSYAFDDEGATLKAELSKLINSNAITKEQANDILGAYAFDDDGVTLKSRLAPLVSDVEQEEVPQIDPETLANDQKLADEELLYDQPTLASNLAQNYNISPRGASLLSSLLPSSSRQMMRNAQGEESTHMGDLMRGASDVFSLIPRAYVATLGSLAGGNEFGKTLGTSRYQSGENEGFGDKAGSFALNALANPLTYAPGLPVAKTAGELAAAKVMPEVLLHLPKIQQLFKNVSSGAVEGGVNALAQAPVDIAMRASDSDIGSVGDEAKNAALSTLIGGGLGGVTKGAIGAFQKVGTDVPRQELGGIENLSKDLNAKAENQAILNKMSPSEYEAQPENLKAIGDITDEDRLKIDEYTRKISDSSYDENSILSQKGTESLNKLGERAKQESQSIGDEFNNIEAKALGGEIDLTPIRSHLSNVISEFTGFAPKVVEKENGAKIIEMTPISNKTRAIVGGELYNSAKEMAKHLMIDQHEAKLSGQELRNLEIILKDALPKQQAGTKNPAFDKSDRMLKKFISGKSESVDPDADDFGNIEELDDPKSILALIQEQVNSSNQLTPDEKARYGELRNEFRKAKNIEDVVNRQSKRVVDGQLQGGAIYMNRLTSGSGDQGANALAKWYKSKTGEDFAREAHLIKASNQYARDALGKKDARITGTKGVILNPIVKAFKKNSVESLAKSASRNPESIKRVAPLKDSPKVAAKLSSLSSKKSRDTEEREQTPQVKAMISKIKNSLSALASNKK